MDLGDFVDGNAETSSVAFNRFPLVLRRHWVMLRLDKLIQSPAIAGDSGLVHQGRATLHGIGDVVSLAPLGQVLGVADLERGPNYFLSVTELDGTVSAKHEKLVAGELKVDCDARFLSLQKMALDHHTESDAGERLTIALQTRTNIFLAYSSLMLQT